MCSLSLTYLFVYLSEIFISYIQEFVSNKYCKYFKQFRNIFIMFLLMKNHETFLKAIYDYTYMILICCTRYKFLFCF